MIDNIVINSIDTTAFTLATNILLVLNKKGFLNKDKFFCIIRLACDLIARTVKLRMDPNIDIDWHMDNLVAELS
jgi:hypothetical protein